MLACATLLGDLFPVAWPPSGAARAGQGSHAPPAQMRYRAALAKSFEPSTQEALKNLMACAVASESLVFRAALVRLCARASGERPLYRKHLPQLSLAGLQDDDFSPHDVARDVLLSANCPSCI